MNRFILNLLAGATILVGGWLVLSPAPASAGDQACCYHKDDKCCGDMCRIKDGACSACTGLFCVGFLD